MAPGTPILRCPPLILPPRPTLTVLFPLEPGHDLLTPQLTMEDDGQWLLTSGISIRPLFLHFPVIAI